MTSERDQALQVERLLRTLDAYDRELADIAYAMSHDLRAPLRSIEGFSEAIAEDYGEAIGEIGRSYIARLRAAAANMERMISDLMALSKVTRSPLQRIEVNASEMVETIAARLRQRDPDRDVAFVIEPDVRVSADRELLEIALAELCANAWKFTSKHPRATIEFGRDRSDQMATFYLHDDGAGFDPAYVEKMFVPFQRLHTQAEFPGNGLGLAIVRRIAHRHFGTVAAKGCIEEGATIYFHIG